MFDQKLKKITRWGLTINGHSVYFRTKESAIKVGIISTKADSKTTMFEEYLLWDISKNPANLLDKKIFDRTNLISNNLNLL